MALVEMREDLIARPQDGSLSARCVLLGNEAGDARALRVVVLLRDAEDVRADHLRHVQQDIRQPLGVVLLVDVLDVVALLALRLRVANIENIETQGFRQVVEPV